jgi:uncharacterized protein (TIGR02246 family)
MRFRSVICVLATLAAAGCISIRTGSNTAAALEAAGPAAIQAALNSTAAAWNRGDLPGYLAVYTPDATEMLPTGPAGGVDAIEKTMREGFWKNGAPAQQLHYEHVVVRMLGSEGAVTTGQFVLTGAGRPDRTGWFTTVWKRTANGWKMIHDHS